MEKIHSWPSRNRLRIAQSVWWSGASKTICHIVRNGMPKEDSSAQRAPHAVKLSLGESGDRFVRNRQDNILNRS